MITGCDMMPKLVGSFSVKHSCIDSAVDIKLLCHMKYELYL